MNRDEAARVLGIPADAPAAQVRAAFRAGVRQQHPDSSGQPGSVAVSLLVEARRTLLTPIPAATGAAPPAPPRPVVPVDTSSDPAHHPEGAAFAGPVDARVEGDTLLVRADPATVVARLVEAGHALGEVTYLDRSAGLVEVLLQVQEEGDPAPAACSLVVSLQGRLDGVEVFCTVERLDGHRAPPVAPIVAALAAAMGVSPA